jgi:peptide/nickel transport system substrate-binding protein
MRSLRLVLTLLVLIAVPNAAWAAPEGQATWAAHVSLVPTWFDPGETTTGTQFMVTFALHDALLKPMPGNPMAPSLAESWTASPDGLAYEFRLRKGVTFHNGDPLTAEDVKFTFERYKGLSAAQMKERVRAVEVVDPERVRFVLKQPWPDFLAFYGTLATGAGWVVPKKYLERVGDAGFKTAPVGAGPYRFVSFTPGVEVVFEAYEKYWRKVPSVKRIVIKMVPEETTRLAMLKRQEADVTFYVNGALAEELRNTPGLTLKPTLIPSVFFVVFTEQWDPKSPWADRRVRLAANHAINRQAINQAETLGFSRITASIIPHRFDFAWPAPLYAYDPARARQLLAEAGYPNGFEGGDFFSDNVTTSVVEAIVNDFRTVGIRTRVRPMERAAFFGQFREKKLRGVLLAFIGVHGNAATRLDAFVAAGGVYTYGSHPDIEGLIQEQRSDLDRKKREATLHRIQQMVYERAMFAPLWELAFMNGHGPRLAESGLGLITDYFYSAPYEDVRLKGK